jgi:hypothetical protein
MACYMQLSFWIKQLPVTSIVDQFWSILIQKFDDAEHLIQQYIFVLHAVWMKKIENHCIGQFSDQILS